MKVPYTTHFGGKTIYADMDAKHKAQVLNTLQRGVNALMELSNINADYQDLLFGPYPEYGKHTAAGANRYNSLASFAGGLLNQHLSNPKKDISVKMLPGITLATRLFREVISTDYLEYEFVREDQNKPRNPAGSPFEWGNY